MTKFTSVTRQVNITIILRYFTLLRKVQYDKQILVILSFFNVNFKKLTKIVRFKKRQATKKNTIYKNKLKNSVNLKSIKNDTDLKAGKNSANSKNKPKNVNFQAQKAFVVKTLAKFAIICPKNSRIVDDGVF